MLDLKPLTPNTMKPLSIKIEAYGPYSAEQTAEAFQKHCFSKGIGWPELTVKNIEPEFIKQNYSIAKRDYIVKNCPIRLFYNPDDAYARQWFTLPTDWKAFKTYLDEYIAFHQKSEPQAGKHYQNSYSKEIFKILEVRDGGELLIAYSDGVPKLNDLEQLGPPATPSSVAQYEKTRKETALLEEARRRYKEGDELYWDEFECWNCTFDSSKLRCTEGGCIAVGDHVIYDSNDNTWAEIIKEETREQQLEKALRDILAWNGGRYGSDYQKDLDKAKGLLNK